MTATIVPDGFVAERKNPAAPWRSAEPADLARVLLWRKRRATQHDSMIMDAFSPELAHHWLAGQGSVADERAEGSADDALSLGEQAALEELAERVSAARSVY